MDRAHGNRGSWNVSTKSRRTSSSPRWSPRPTTSWRKSASSNHNGPNQANRLLECSGAFWQPEFHDRYIRDADHFDASVRYIHANPVRTGLVTRAEDWPFSSAKRFALTVDPH